jgi:hypothetical protein
MDICRQQEPPQVKGGEDHYAYCWLLEETHE